MRVLFTVAELHRYAESLVADEGGLREPHSSRGTPPKRRPEPCRG
jgi:hypothetical protein